MEFIKHECELVDALKTPGIPYEERPTLDPYISHERLHFKYGQIADIMLQYSKHTFIKIGCIALINDDFRRANVCRTPNSRSQEQWAGNSRTLGPANLLTVYQSGFYSSFLSTGQKDWTIGRTSTSNAFPYSWQLSTREKLLS